MFHRSSRKRTTATLSVLLVPVMALAAGCGSGTPEAGPPEPSRQPAARLVLPFDDYRLTADDIALIVAAEDALMRRCMERENFGWTRPERSTAVRHRLLQTSENARRYGLTDERAAQRHGYHVPAEPRVLRVQAEERSWRAGLSPAEEKALFGENGCASEAAERLRAGGGTPGASWFTSYDFDSVDASAAAPSVRPALARWRACMTERGFRYDTPRAAVEDKRWNLDSKAPTSQEIAVATADVRCKEETGLITVRAAAERRIQDDLITRHSGKFASLKRGLQRYLDNAGKALSGE